MKLSDIARFLHGEIAEGGELEIERLAKIEEAGDGDITFFANPKYARHLATTGATAILIARESNPAELKSRTSPLILVRVDDPYVSFLRLIDLFYPPAKPLGRGVHPSAVIGEGVTLGNDVGIGANVVLGAGCIIGAGATLHPGVVLGDGVTIGNYTTLYQNVSIREGCRIGERCILHPGAVIGSDGFGFAPLPDGTYEKIPQRGIVVIEDDVEIGATCAIDRATIGETRIKKGVKLDNLIHVAHNVIIGENTVIAAQTGISGSTKIGKNCIFAGQVGFTGHITIADRTMIGAQSGIPKSITEPGTSHFGYPAKEHRRAFRIEAVVKQLPELLEEIRKLRAEVDRLKSGVSSEQSTKE